MTRPTIAWLFVGFAFACSSAHTASIDRSEYLRAGDAQLYLLIRGADRTAPVLVWLHGGPGGAERPLFRYFNHELESRFVCVYLDQRGAGRSFDPEADRRHLTVAQHVSDLDIVIDHLRNELRCDKVVLVGHSWGAALALLYAQLHPAKITAIVGVNPLISKLAAERAEYEFVIDEASARHDVHTLERARSIGPAPFGNARRALTIETLGQRYGGVFHKDLHRVWIMTRAIVTGLVTPLEIVRIIRGNNVSLDAMYDELLRLNLAESARTLDVPVLFFVGRHDHHLDPTIATSYLQGVQAPVKRLKWFEQSAHNIPFEEPALFDATLISELTGLSSPASAKTRGPGLASGSPR